MSCERFRPALAAHAAGSGLDEAAARHVSGCAACRQLLDTQQQMLAELDGEIARSLSISASPDFAARVVRGTRNAGAPAARWMPAPLWAGLALAAAIVLAVWVRQPGVDNRSHRADVHLNAESVGRASSVGPGSSDPGRRAPARGRTAPPVAAARPGTQPHDRMRRLNPDPPVIVAPTQARAIERLRELMTQGRLDEQMLPPPVTPEASLAELAIAPLEVAEIRVPDVQIVSRPPAAPQRQ